MSSLYSKKTINSLSDSESNYRVRWSSPDKWLPFPYKQHSNLAAPGDIREVTLQVRVWVKAGVEIGRNKECVAGNSYESVEYLWLRSTW